MAVTNSQTEELGGGAGKRAPALSAVRSSAADPVLSSSWQGWLMGQRGQPLPKGPALPTAPSG